MTSLLLLLLLACTGTPDGSEVAPDPPPERVDPDQVGPYAAGVTTLELDDPRGETVKVEVWYPAIDPGGEPDPYEEITIAGSAFRDAVPDRRGAPYPLVAFSHGNGGIRFQNATMVEHLATHGFVVVAPDHRNNSIFDLDSSEIGIVLVERPGEVSRAVDGLLAHPDLGDLADGAEVVAMGHSFGGVTSLVLGGGRYDFDHAEPFCLENQLPGCKILFDADELGDPEVAQPDPRVVALVDISPGAVYAFGDDGLDDLVPSLAIGGRDDRDLPYVSEARPVMDALPAPKTLVTLEDVGHWSVTDMCLIIPFLVDCTGEDDGWADPEVTSQRVRTLVTAFAGRHLVGDARYEPFLSQDAWPADEVVVE